MSYTGDVFGGNFVSGRSYTLALGLVSETPTLPLNATLNVPGATSAVYEYYDEIDDGWYYAYIMIVYTVGGAPDNIDEVAITLPTIEVGGDVPAASDIIVSATGASLAATGTFEMDTEVAKFEDGKAYYVSVIMKADSGYVFEDEPTVTVTNSDTASLKFESSDCYIVEKDGISYAAVDILVRIGSPTPYIFQFLPGAGSGTWCWVFGRGNYEFPECDFTAPANKIFKAWKVSGDNTEYQPGDTITPTKDLLLVAQWEDAPKPTYSVTFDGTNCESNGAVTATTAENYTATISKSANRYKLPTSIVVQAGENTLVAGVDYTYNADNGKVTINASAITGNITITAVAVPNTYTVTFKGEYYTTEGANTAIHGEDYVVTLKPDAGYEIHNADLVIKIGGNVLMNYYGEWTFDDATDTLTIVGAEVDDNLTISVSPDEIVTAYDVTFDGENYTHNGSDKAAIGSDYVVTFTPAAGYEIDNADIVVKVNHSAIYGWTFDDATDTLTIPAEKVTGNIEISVSPDKIPGIFTVTWTNGTGYQITAAPGYSSPVTEGEDFHFVVTLGGDYKEGANYKVKANGVELTKIGGGYAIENITANTVITVEDVIAKPTYTVTLPTGTGFTAVPAATFTTTVVEGNDFSFVVSVVGNYREGANFKVNANGVEIVKSGDLYTIENITANQVITVEGVEALPEYTITLPTGTGFTSAPAATYTTTVVEGKDFHFVVSVTGNYREGANFKVKANGVELTKTSGYYVITNVTANQVITVEGVEELPKYTVTLPTGTGFTSAPAAGNSSPVYEGGSFSFVVSIADGYRANANFKVKANGVELTKDGTGYTITNITANVTVTVEGVEKIPTGGGSVTPPVHTHNYGTTWKTDGTNHWHECSCGDKKDSAAHTGGTATCTAKAKCSVCNVEKGDLAPHSYVEGKCSCGATDPNYVAPHEHTFVEGKCECGETDPNYTPETNDPGTDVPGTDVPGNDDPQTPDDNDGLGTGAIVAIVVGSVLVGGVGGFALVWFVIKKKTWAEFLAIFKKG